MRKLFKTAILGVSALALPFVFAATVNAEGPSDADAINTKLEYQVNANNNSMRFISTIELNGKTLDDITSIDMNFDLTKEGQETKHSKTQTTTTVYESISGENGKEKVDGTYYAVITITNIDSKSGWRITPTFTYNYEDGSTEDVSASSWLIGGKRQYFVQAYTDWGTDLYYYMYKSETEHNKAWPGEQMHLYDADNHIYYFDYMPSAGYTTVIFNNGDFVGHNETAHMPVSSEYNYYLQQDENAFPHPTASHNIVTQYNNNEHYSHCTICGDDFDYERHTLSSTIDSITGKKHITCSECEIVANLNPNIFYFTAPNDWENVKVHLWVEGGVGTTWPGAQATYVSLNEFGEKIYSIDTTGYEKMIFNNAGAGSQTVDITIADCGAYNAIYCDWDHKVDNKPTPGYYIYIPENYEE